MAPPMHQIDTYIMHQSDIFVNNFNEISAHALSDLLEYKPR